MNFSPMSAFEKTGLAVSGDEIGDCIDTLSDGNQIRDQRIPIDAFSNGQGFNLGIINQYGQLMGEYSKLDDELWFSKSEDDEAMTGSHEGHQWNFISAHEQNVDLQKLSNLVDNSLCYGGTAVVKESSSSLKNSSLDQSQTSSPSSILQSVIKRARSKRFRPSKCNSHKAFQSLDQNHSFQSESYVKPPPLDEIAEPTPRTRKIDDLLQSGSGERDQNPDAEPTRKRKPSKKAMKKCLHCESTRTPQWREGPMGRATLCNACGVQYRNGRLSTEYRPLSSPTFDPSLHTNVPKKLRRMRMSKDTDNCAVSANSGMAT